MTRESYLRAEDERTLYELYCSQKLVPPFPLISALDKWNDSPSLIASEVGEISVMKTLSQILL